ncbi:hypothetical protein FA95DRAFT_444115 [Auriscalpium vulgare]|uniref:Uncharacterized protein n=1 Tax=Auriscalpium vulgare TaxID=40419 RepID=A0ACB8RFT6_9AGAM|nr:hypothetical protein FA95DRAFT_444115 [Auriscalpium vulgare]
MSQDIDVASQGNLTWSYLLSSRLATLDAISASSASSVQQKLDDELSHLERVSREVRARRNALSPTHRLPQEVLAHVFSILAEQAPPLEDPSHDHIGWMLLGWITVTHVCQHWRQVALYNPTLWAREVSSHPAWTQVRLERSKDALISVKHGISPRAYIEAPSAVAALRCALTESRRIEEFYLREDSSLMKSILDEYFHSPFPFLHTLEVHNATAQITRWHDAPHPDATNLHIPSDIFLFPEPRLRRLVLSNCCVPWEERLFKSLVHVDIALAGGKNRLPADTFLSLVEIMRQLQFLKVSNAVSDIDDAPDRVVSLAPSLAYFSLTGEAVANYKLFGRLDLPPSAHLAIGSILEGEADGLPSVIPQRRDLIGPLRALTVDCRTGRQIIVTGWDHPYTCDQLDSFFTSGIQGNSLASPTVEIALSWTTPQSGGDLLAKSLRSLDLSSVSTLYIFHVHIYNAPKPIGTTWMHDFFRFHCLQHMCLRGDAWAFLQLLAVPSPLHDPDSDGSDDHLLAFPDLRVIRFFEVNFHQWLYDEFDEHEDDNATLSDGVVSVLSERLVQNDLLDIIDIKRSAINAAWVEEMKEIAPYVEWDGEERGHVTGEISNLSPLPTQALVDLPSEESDTDESWVGGGLPGWLGW